MKRVLIIVYYWPPTGGSGVQRWVKFVKHLRSFGWEPVIFTPENPFVHERDETLLKEIPEGVEVIRHPVFEITRYFGAPNATAASANTKASFFSRIKKSVGNYVRGNFFIPDPRMLWVNPSVKFLTQYLKENRIDAIASSGPPHSLHLIAYKLSKKLGMPWLADFRDPWLEVLNFHGFKTSEVAYDKHVALYKQVINQADVTVVAQNTVRSNFQKNTTKPVVLITNGYDTDDLKPDPKAVQLDKTKFNLVFVGIFYAIRNAPIFWQALEELLNENESFRNYFHLVFVGKGQQEVMSSLTKHNLLPYCEFTGYVNHGMAINYQKQADGLLLFTGLTPEFKYDIPGKLFEYLSVQRPIICIAQHGNDSAEIIKRTGSGYVVGGENVAEIKAAILHLFERYSKGDIQLNSTGFQEYERKALTEKLVTELNRITNNK